MVERKLGKTTRILQYHAKKKAEKLAAQAKESTNE